MKISNILKRRIYAYTTDLFVVIISNYFITASFTNFLKTVFFHFPLKTQLFLIEKLGVMSSISLISLTFAYFSLFLFLSNGKTLGKAIFNLKVVSQNEELTINESMIRAFSYFICSIFGSVLFLISFFRKDEKSLADLLSKTHVVDDQEQTAEVTGLKTEFQLTLVDSIKENQIQENDEVEYFEQNKAA